MMTRLSPGWSIWWTSATLASCCVVGGMLFVVSRTAQHDSVSQSLPPQSLAGEVAQREITGELQPQMSAGGLADQSRKLELELQAAAEGAVLNNPQPAPPAMMAAAYKSVVIADVPHIRQKPDFCGEACAAMFLQKQGQQVDQDYVYDQSGLDPVQGRGCYTRELAQALTNIGFKTGPVWHKVPVRTSNAELESHWAAVHADLLRGFPAIVCTRFDERPNTTEHFRLILGYDAAKDEVLYHDPALDDGKYLRMTRTRLLSLWPLKYTADEWTVIRMSLAFSELRKGETSQKFTAADYAQHVLALKEKLPSKDFSLVIQPPFVVIGDDTPQRVQRTSDGTVRWAVERLRAELFDRDPDRILDIWLFKDKESYETNAKQLFGEGPGTPFGYYSPAHGALVMNISTGGGTLVHEIVHPFVAADFPRCPSWLNEGLGSLYEQCGDHDGKIWGFTNWRLAGLQQAIAAKRVPSFETLCSTTRNGFYTDDPGTNYSQARYLCYYLQEHGLLVKFYRQFRQDAQDDPTGYQTLQKILKEDDMAAFQARWEKYVSGLKFQ